MVTPAHDRHHRPRNSWPCSIIRVGRKAVRMNPHAHRNHRRCIQAMILANRRWPMNGGSHSSMALPSTIWVSVENWVSSRHCSTNVNWSETKFSYSAGHSSRSLTWSSILNIGIRPSAARRFSRTTSMPKWKPMADGNSVSIIFASMVSGHQFDGSPHRNGLCFRQHRHCHTDKLHLEIQRCQQYSITSLHCFNHGWWHRY